MLRAKTLTVVRAFSSSLSDADRLGSKDNLVWIPPVAPPKAMLICCAWVQYHETLNRPFEAQEHWIEVVVQNTVH
ncbi:hypothetical protein M431DRAFT_433563 [Trichoderma harzianum CBS 226.95]|uniref:Uncharacterized protein n=1 Tax=Trichoderma harzianum CBS 226.95 TaxID=983964 RepID=A0A2T4AD33_TRIHA|nr:hypothetical protein M431DRAFT_433563 [Trichoderma harzianum CBS 226.95]PTB54923.1 hypothetical protein M431DRAFT_433563 [Trichoderma harzianum CBS 226.95]